MSDFKLFQNWIYTQYIEFEYPNQCALKDLSEAFSKEYQFTSLWIYGPSQDIRDVNPPVLNINIYPKNADNPYYQNVGEGLERKIQLIHTSASELQEWNEDLANSFIRENKILSDREIEVDETKARELVMAHYDYQEGKQFVERNVAFKKGSCVYEFSFQVPDEGDDKYIHVYERFLSTFRVSF